MTPVFAECTGIHTGVTSWAPDSRATAQFGAIAVASTGASTAGPSSRAEAPKTLTMKSAAADAITATWSNAMQSFQAVATLATAHRGVHSRVTPHWVRLPGSPAAADHAAARQADAMGVSLADSLNESKDPAHFGGLICDEMVTAGCDGRFDRSPYRVTGRMEEQTQTRREDDG